MVPFCGDNTTPPGPLLAHIHISTFPRCPSSTLSSIVACLTYRYFPSYAHTKRSGRIHTTTPTPPPAARPAEYHHTFTRPPINLPTNVPQPVHTSSRPQQTKPPLPPVFSTCSPGNSSLSPRLTSLLSATAPAPSGGIDVTGLCSGHPSCVYFVAFPFPLSHEVDK